MEDLTARNEALSACFSSNIKKGLWRVSVSNNGTFEHVLFDADIELEMVKERVILFAIFQGIFSSQETAKHSKASEQVGSDPQKFQQANTLLRIQNQHFDVFCQQKETCCSNV